MPWPTFRNLPCRTSSSHTAAGNSLGGVMATMAEPRPLESGPPAMLDSSYSRVSFKRRLNALKAALSSSRDGMPDGGGWSEVDMLGSLFKGLGQNSGTVPCHLAQKFV